jgi:hypothetical protein
MVAASAGDNCGSPRFGWVWMTAVESVGTSMCIDLPPPAVSFTLEPTKNIWNFILLDTSDGRTWQVQWGQNPFLRRRSNF